MGAIPPVGRPEVRLFKDGVPIEPYAADAVAFRLPLAGADFVAPEDQTVLEGDFNFVLDFGREGQERYRLAMDIFRAHAPRLRRGREYEVLFYQNDRDVFLAPSQGVVIHDEEGRLVYVMSTDEGVPLKHLPAGLSVLPSPGVAFSTTMATTTGCTVRKEHHFVELTGPGRKARIAPGDRKIVRTNDGYFKFVLFDYSLSSDDMECQVEAPPHFSYVLSAVEQDR